MAKKRLITSVRVLLLFFISALLLSSCATILGGKKNTIKINAGSPEQAQVYLDGKYIGDAPFKKRISKYDLQEGSIIEIRKDNYKTMSYEVTRKPHIIYVGADILLGVIPLIIDVADGNIYRPNTRNIHYELKPVKSIKKANISVEENKKK